MTPYLLERSRLWGRCALCTEASYIRDRGTPESVTTEFRRINPEGGDAPDGEGPVRPQVFKTEVDHEE